MISVSEFFPIIWNDILAPILNMPFQLMQPIGETTVLEVWLFIAVLELIVHFIVWLITGNQAMVESDQKVAAKNKK